MSLWDEDKRCEECKRPETDAPTFIFFRLSHLRQMCFRTTQIGNKSKAEKEKGDDKKGATKMNKPCPCCGKSRAKPVTEVVWDTYEYIFMQCQTCKASGARFDLDRVEYAKQKAIDSWNTRPLEDEKDAEIVRLEAEVNNLKGQIVLLSGGGHKDSFPPVTTTVTVPDFSSTAKDRAF